MTRPPLGPLARLSAALDHLAQTVDARALEGDAGTSWTARLLAKGPDAVAAKLEARQGTSGLAEKASRPKD
tara:strand:- start:127 stop:339 length:213 start_codon:yes stop_codon:yes gene_type:complete